MFTARYELDFTHNLIDSHSWDSFSDQTVNLVGDRAVVDSSGGTMAHQQTTPASNVNTAHAQYEWQTTS